MSTIAVGSDHAGYSLKQRLATELRTLGHEVLDLGAHDADRVDYPDFGAAVGRAVAGAEVPGVRAAPVHDATSARLARQHNDANVLCLGERLLDPDVASEAVRAWLDAEFEGGRHVGRVAKLAELDGSVG